MKKCQIKTILFIAAALVLSVPLKAAEYFVGQQGSNKPSLKVLFIGNSQIDCYSLPRMIQVMTESTPAGRPRIESGRAYMGGTGLKGFWKAGTGEGTPRGMIAAEKWDYVVIQEIFANKDKGGRPDPQEFEDYATRFDHAIKCAGSKTVVFATATVTEFYKRSYHYPDEFKALNDMQIAFGKKKGLPVAAAGYAWMRYLGPNPTLEQRLDLYDKDRGHPGAKGTYIYACLLYAVLTGLNPEGLPHEFKNIRGGINIPGDEALKMQQVAWDQYQENKAQSSQSEASVNLLKQAQTETISKFKEELAVPGKFTADMEACEKRINASGEAVRKQIIEDVADLTPGLTGETWRILVEAAEGTDAATRQIALRALIISVPADKIIALVNTVRERARLAPTIKRMRELYKGQKWQALIDEFKDTDVSNWPDDWTSEALSMRGEGYCKLKNGKEAEADLKKAIDSFPSIKSPVMNQSPIFTWFRLAENYQENMKDDQKALEAYIKVVEMTKGKYWWLPRAAVLRSSDILSGLGRNEEALKILESSGWKKDSQLNSAYVKTLAALGRKADAIAACNKRLQIEGISAAEKEAIGKKLKELEGDASQPPKK